KTRLDSKLVGLGYSIAETATIDPANPAGLGYIAAQAVIDARANDGSNQYGSAACPAGNVCPTVPVTTLAAAPCSTDTFPWTTTPLKHLRDSPAALQPP